MKDYDRNTRLVYLCLSIIFLMTIIFDSEIMFFLITRSIIGLFLGIFVVGDEIRNWVFRSSTSIMDIFEILALNIAFSISFLIGFGAVLSYFHLLTSFILSTCLACLIIISLFWRFILDLPK